MGSGEHVENTLDLLSGKCFNEFILEMKKQFDFIGVRLSEQDKNYIVKDINGIKIGEPGISTPGISKPTAAV